MLLFIKPSFVNELNSGEGGPPHPHVAPFPYPLPSPTFLPSLPRVSLIFNPLPLPSLSPSLSISLFLSFACPPSLSRFRTTVSLIRPNAQSMPRTAFRPDYPPKNSHLVVVRRTAFGDCLYEVSEDSVETPATLRRSYQKRVLVLTRTILSTSKPRYRNFIELFNATLRIIFLRSIDTRVREKSTLRLQLV